MAMVEKTVGIYNEELAGDTERVVKLLNGIGDEQQKFPLMIDLADSKENVHGVAKGQVAYLVAMAKADALELLGENRQALKLVDRHV